MAGAAPHVTMIAAAFSDASGGVYRAVLNQSRAQVRQGRSLSWAGPMRPQDRPDPASGIRVWPTRPYGPARLGLSSGLARALGQAAPDLIHLHGLWLQPSAAVLRWRRATGKPLIISPHGMLDPWAMRHSGWKKRLALWAFERQNLREASCLHALNEAELSAIRDAGFRTPVAVIPNGVDLPVRLDKARGDRKTLLFLGRLHPKKGIIETIRAWDILRHAAPDVFADWRLVIAGWDDGGHAGALEQLVRELDLGEAVRFSGPVFGAAKDAAYQSADAFVLASHSEGQPLSVLEAWAYALPVFMTAACNLPEGFAAQAAIAVMPEPESLAQTLAGGLARSDLARIGQNGAALVQARFVWDQIAARHAAVQDWLLQRADRPDCVVGD